MRRLRRQSAVEKGRSDPVQGMWSSGVVQGAYEEVSLGWEREGEEWMADWWVFIGWCSLRRGEEGLGGGGGRGEVGV